MEFIIGHLFRFSSLGAMSMLLVPATGEIKGNIILPQGVNPASVVLTQTAQKPDYPAYIVYIFAGVILTGLLTITGVFIIKIATTCLVIDLGLD